MHPAPSHCYLIIGVLPTVSPLTKVGLKKDVHVLYCDHRYMTASKAMTSVIGINWANYTRILQCNANVSTRTRSSVACILPHCKAQPTPCLASSLPCGTTLLVAPRVILSTPSMSSRLPNIQQRRPYRSHRPQPLPIPQMRHSRASRNSCTQRLR